MPSTEDIKYGTLSNRLGYLPIRGIAVMVDHPEAHQLEETFALGQQKQRVDIDGTSRKRPKNFEAILNQPEETHWTKIYEIRMFQWGRTEFFPARSCLSLGCKGRPFPRRMLSAFWGRGLQIWIQTLCHNHYDCFFFLKFFFRVWLKQRGETVVRQIWVLFSPKCANGVSMIIFYGGWPKVSFQFSIGWGPSNFLLVRKVKFKLLPGFELLLKSELSDLAFQRCI